ncbi:MAG TPA: sulfotransferase [Thermomicrobiales bacterium]|nr:sulfotransferase [Thermomicrobiales bacterium]
MPVIERLELGRVGRGADQFLGMEIESPRSGDASDTFGIRVSGWVLGQEGVPDQVVAGAPGAARQGMPVDQPSPDIAARFPGVPGADRCRWSAMVNTLDYPLGFEIRLRALFRQDDRRARMAELRGRRRALAPGYDARFQPLLVTSLGRTGTTLLMRYLSEHPAIVAYRRYPYEVRGGKYWLHMLRTLAAPADAHKQIGQPNEFHQESLVVGANPFYSAAFGAYPEVEAWQGSDYVDALAGFCLRSIDAWYGRVAAHQAQPAGRFFAEKSFPDAFPRLFRELYPGAREIFLVRDFRDMMASMRAYNVRKGWGDFGRERAGDDDAWLEELKAGVTNLRQGWNERRAGAALVRYEDMLTDPASTLTTLFAALDLDASPGTVAGVLARAAAPAPELAAHGTSESAAASIGRWRRDLDEPGQAAAHAAFADLLLSFGYDV